MFDQADDLRRLAMGLARPKPVWDNNRPTILALTGGKGGVGTTTAAIALVTSLCRIGKRAILIDADPRGGDIALRCGLDGGYALADLLSGRCGWQEAIQDAPKGVRVIAGSRWSESLSSASSAAELLLELLDDPSLPADVVVFDIGNNPGRAGQRLCRAANAVILTTTSDATSVMRAFTTMKSLVRDGRDREGKDETQLCRSFHLLVTMARSAAEARETANRLGRACQRLLGIKLLGMDMSADGLQVLSAAALFARFSHHEAHLGRTYLQTCYFTENN